MERDFNIHEWQAKFLREDSSKQQTAVEWLQTQIGYRENGKDMFEEFFSKAKEMEKNQIEDAFDSGWSRANGTKDTAYSSAEDYGKGYYSNKYK